MPPRLVHVYLSFGGGGNGVGFGDGGGCGRGLFQFRSLEYVHDAAGDGGLHNLLTHGALQEVVLRRVGAQETILVVVDRAL